MSRNKEEGNKLLVIASRMIDIRPLRDRSKTLGSIKNIQKFAQSLGRVLSEGEAKDVRTLCKNFRVTQGGAGIFMHNSIEE